MSTAYEIQAMQDEFSVEVNKLIDEMAKFNSGFLERMMPREHKRYQLRSFVSDEHVYNMSRRRRKKAVAWLNTNRIRSETSCGWVSWIIAA